MSRAALQVIQVDLVDGSIPLLRRLESALLFQSRLIKRSAAPEQEPDAALQLAVTRDWVAIEEPYGVAVPDLVLGLWQNAVDVGGGGIAGLLLFRCLLGVVYYRIGMHGFNRSV
jgi:hypothetical protein